MAEGDLPGLNDETIEKIANKGQELSSQRKQRGKKLPDDLIDVESLAQFQETACHTGYLYSRVHLNNTFQNPQHQSARNHLHGLTGT
jgi:coproporphyrinogen III oxidase-like Fe-S oxidoreductase